MPRLIALAINGPSFANEMQRVWENGDAILPLDLRLPLAMQKQLLDTMGAAAVIDESGEQSPCNNPRPVDTDDALVIATSGTTAEPKGVVHTHASILASAQRTSEALSVSSSDKWLCCLPLAHIGGLSVVMRSILTNTPLTVHSRFDADAVTAEAKNGTTLVSLVPTALQRIDTTLFRRILLGGAASPTKRPTNVIATYGMTETGSGIVYESQPLRDVNIRITIDGEIEVQSPTLFRCYRDGTDPKVDGWFATGDAGEITNDVLHVHGRMNDMINSGGEKIWPADVEAALRTHDAICEVRVFGEPDITWGEQVIAEIELASEVHPTLSELREYVCQTLPRYAAPRQIRFVEKIARAPNGKIRRPSR